MILYLFTLYTLQSMQYYYYTHITIQWLMGLFALNKGLKTSLNIARYYNCRAIVAQPLVYSFSPRVYINLNTITTTVTEIACES